MSLLIGSDKMRLSGEQAGLPGLLSMRVGVPFPWALVPTVPPACSGKRAGGIGGEWEPRGR